MKFNYNRTFLFGAIIGICCTLLTLFLLGNIESEFIFKPENLDKNMTIKNTAQFLTILSYNIKYDNKGDYENNWSTRKDRLIALLKDYNPTIFGVQEGLLGQIKYIDNSFEKYRYIGVGRDDGRKKGEFCAIFYNTHLYEIDQQSTFWLSDTPGMVSVGWDASMERICTYGLFKSKISEEKFWVFNTHFDHIGDNARKESAKLILEKIKNINKSDLPVILMGDFNSEPNDEPIKILEKFMIDGLKISLKKLQGPTGTFNGFDVHSSMDRRIDYIFTKSFKIYSYHHIDDRLENNKHISDHLPVLVKVKGIFP